MSLQNHIKRESRVQNNAPPQMPCGERPVVFSDAFPEKTTLSEPFTIANAVEHREGEAGNAGFCAFSDEA